jgi:hypothetical protein
MTKYRADVATCNSTFQNKVRISDDVYLVEKDSVAASCKKPIQTAFATLSNAKYWFNTFVYKFMYKCLDRNKFHFVVCDTDSYMWAVAGDGSINKLLHDEVLKGLSPCARDKILRKIVPHFEEIVCDRKFYEQHYPTWFPSKKTLLTLEYEHCCKNLIALAPKNYCCITEQYKEDGKTVRKEDVRTKGATRRGNINKDINEKAFKENLSEGKIKSAQNYTLRQKDHRMTFQYIKKTALSGVITKAVVLENQAFAPFVHGISAKDYVVDEGLADDLETSDIITED